MSAPPPSREPQHLVILRGNSASGKTTLAAELQRAMGRGTANVGQDHLRRGILREHDVPGGDNIGLIDHVVRHCLGIGYHVILEGILVSDHYREMLTGLIDHHPGPSHTFYLDASLEETLHRHAGRPLSADVTPDQVRDWYVPHDTLGLPGEVLLDGRADLESMRELVLAHLGPVTPKAPTKGARFL